MSSSNLPNLVQYLVPESRDDTRLREDLIAQSTLILRSQIGNNSERDHTTVKDAIERSLKRQGQSATAIQRFSNLSDRFNDSPLMTRKAAVLEFLNAVSNAAQTTSTPQFIPSFDPPKSTKPPPKLSNANDANVPTSTPTGKSKAEMLRLYRTKLGKPHLPEEALLRDALYILQGISGKYVNFVARKDESGESTLHLVDDPEFIISKPNRDLIHRLAELGHLYTRIASFVRPDERKSNAGVIEQSLCHYMETQLTEYYRLIAVLESQMHFSSGDSKDSSDGEAAASGLTLKRLDVWVDDWRLRLRMMSACVEGCRDVHGGALVNLLQSYTNNGDPFIQSFTDELLEEVSKPFFAMLHKWLFSGELYDPHSEFFVAINPALANVQFLQPRQTFISDDVSPTDRFGDMDDLSREQGSGLKLWENKYIFKEDMLPAFVGEALGRKIFSTGKSLNFIRYSCHDNDWVATREKLQDADNPLKYSDFSGFERSIQSAYSIASQRLFDVFFEKFKLMDHLNAFKHYLMLGYGDFAEQLMESLGPNLSRPANTLYRHNLTATLETAIRSSNAQNDPAHVLRRLDARMLEYTHGEIGWDVFTLEYRVDAPIDTVLNSETIVNYQRIFTHLWNTKRIEGSLTSGWMQVSGGARSFFRVPELDKDWHYVRIVLAEMIHSIRQVQAHCRYIIDEQWKNFIKFIEQKEGDLDEFISRHRNYVQNVKQKLLLERPKAGRESSVYDSLKEIYTVILHFRTAMDDLFSYTMKEAARLDSAKDTARGLVANPKMMPETASSKDSLARILQRVREYGSSFSDKAANLVIQVAKHEDSECKSLSSRLNFSEHYKVKREAQVSQKIPR